MISEGLKQIVHDALAMGIVTAVDVESGPNGDYLCTVKITVPHIERMKDFISKNQSKIAEASANRQLSLPENDEMS